MNVGGFSTDGASARRLPIVDLIIAAPSDDLVLMIAGKIYHREHGMLPPSDEALLGTYLKSLPENSSIDQGDEMPAIVK